MNPPVCTLESSNVLLIRLTFLLKRASTERLQKTSPLVAITLRKEPASAYQVWLFFFSSSLPFPSSHSLFQAFASITMKPTILTLIASIRIDGRIRLLTTLGCLLLICSARALVESLRCWNSASYWQWCISSLHSELRLKGILLLLL